ncbi:MAG: alpha/beta hydrolase [Chloroflexi bacterium]|nr:alpha/beta hydrolase [Chloroflexota bacterium]
MFIERPYAQLYSVAFGNSPRTLLAIGGWAGSWEVWTDTLADLSPTWRTIAYDHRGAGASSCAVESIMLDYLVSDVFAVMDAYGVDRCILAAESAGAATALLAALERPERVQGLVLVDGVYYQPDDPKSPFLQGLKTRFEATIGAFVDNCVTEEHGDMWRRWGRQILMRSEPAAAIRLYECAQEIDLRARLREIVIPTLILHGRDDRILPLVSSEWLATQLKNCHMEVIDGAGHVPTVTRPHIVADAINRYFG